MTVARYCLIGRRLPFLTSCSLQLRQICVSTSTGSHGRRTGGPRSIGSHRTLHHILVECRALRGEHTHVHSQTLSPTVRAAGGRRPFWRSKLPLCTNVALISARVRLSLITSGDGAHTAGGSKYHDTEPTLTLIHAYCVMRFLFGSISFVYVP